MQNALSHGGTCRWVNAKKRRNCIENALELRIGGTSRGFTNIKSNLNMSRSDWECSQVHTFRLNQTKWTFPRKYEKMGILFFGRWANGFPAMTSMGCSVLYVLQCMKSGLILRLHPANEIRRYKLTRSLIDFAQNYTQLCAIHISFEYIAMCGTFISRSSAP